MTATQMDADGPGRHLAGPSAVVEVVRRYGVASGPAQATTGTLEAFTGPSSEEMQARIRMDALADALEDALGQIQELRERLDRIEGDHPQD